MEENENLGSKLVNLDGLNASLPVVIKFPEYETVTTNSESITTVHCTIDIDDEFYDSFYKAWTSVKNGNGIFVITIHHWHLTTFVYNNPITEDQELLTHVQFPIFMLENGVEDAGCQFGIVHSSYFDDDSTTDQYYPDGNKPSEFFVAEIMFSSIFNGEITGIDFTYVGKAI